MLDAAKQWYADIAELRQKYTLMVVENTSKEIKEFFIEKGVGNYFSTPYEQWQNMAEFSIKSIMLLAKTEMAESGLAGRFWYSATDFGRSRRNATFKQRLGKTPHAKIFGIKKDVSKIRPFGCLAYLHLNKERREPGKHAPRAVGHSSWICIRHELSQILGPFNRPVSLHQPSQVRRGFIPLSQQGDD